MFHKHFLFYWIFSVLFDTLKSVMGIIFIYQNSVLGLVSLDKLSTLFIWILLHFYTFSNFRKKNSNNLELLKTNIYVMA